MIDIKGELIKGSRTKPEVRERMLGNSGLGGLKKHFDNILEASPLSMENLIDSVGLIIISFFIGINDSRVQKYKNAKESFVRSLYVSQRNTDDSGKEKIDVEEYKDILDRAQNIMKTHERAIRQRTRSAKSFELYLKRAFSGYSNFEYDYFYSRLIIESFVENNKDSEEFDLDFLKSAIAAAKELEEFYNDFISKSQENMELTQNIDESRINHGVDQLDKFVKSFNDTAIKLKKTTVADYMKEKRLKREDLNLTKMLIDETKDMIVLDEEFIKRTSPISVARIYQRIYDFYIYSNDLSKAKELKEKYFELLNLFVDNYFAKASFVNDELKQSLINTLPLFKNNDEPEEISSDLNKESNSRFNFIKDIYLSI